MPSNSDLATWLANLQQNGIQDATTGASIPYANAQAIFAEQGIPEPTWIATLYAESGGVGKVTNVPGQELSYGPWQFNVLGGLGAGIPASTLNDPAQSTTLAASQFARLFAANGITASSPLADQIHALGFDWPGSPNGAGAATVATRQTLASQFAQILSGTGGSAPSATVSAGASATSPAPAAHTPASSTGDWFTPIENDLFPNHGDLTFGEYWALIGVGVVGIMASLYWIAQGELAQTIREAAPIAEAAA